MTSTQVTVLVLVAVGAATAALVLWWNRRGDRQASRAGMVLAAGLEGWAANHGWRPGPPPTTPAVAQRVSVRSLTPLAAASGRVEGLPAKLSLWRSARSHLGSPVRFRSLVWVASAPLGRPSGPEPFGMGTLAPRSGVRTAGDVVMAGQTARMVTVPRVLATRRATYPWGLARIPVWPTSTLPADAQHWAGLAAELDRLDAFLLVTGAEVSLSMPAMPPSATTTGPSPDALLGALALSVAAVRTAPGHSAHTH